MQCEILNWILPRKKKKRYWWDNWLNLKEAYRLVNSIVSVLISWLRSLCWSYIRLTLRKVSEGI